MGYYDEGNLHKEFICGLLSVTFMAGAWWQTGRHGAAAKPESLYLETQSPDKETDN